MPPVVEDPALDWDLGSPRRARSAAVIIIAVAITVVAVVLIVGTWRVVDATSAPTPTPTPTAIALAQPLAYEGDAGYPIGFPHTELGAASAAAAALEAAWTLDGAQAEQAAVLYAPPEQRKAASDGARAAVSGWRATLGLPKDGKLPEGASLRTQTIGVQWRARAQDQVQVSILVQVTATTGGDGDGPTYSSPYAMTLLMAWYPGVRGDNQGDWVNIPDPTPPAVPQTTLPGTPEFAAAGWKPLKTP
ncbi:hypothetical protein [Microtetraspora sp. NBRC 16547]|uniref:hypothetical protein n=1 Tax=Microtetraspora sp. NBRC 16547 TaxID=3030993 RepID=UPI00249FA39E|nr:hypothetical protein [Microtetraspora sp. NBRC 16547]GLX01821.1 hypothetical protein Misp02_59070 [Microtetraspora sp. NBRC 16547]